MKENEELNKENEKLQKYIISSEFRYSLAMKAIFENKKLKKEINKYKEEIEKNEDGDLDLDMEEDEKEKEKDNKTNIDTKKEEDKK